jgi:WD40 repeat protein
VSEARAETPSLVERARAIDAGGAVIAVHFLGDTLCYVLGEEAILLVPPQSEPRRLPVHSGAILASAAGGGRLLTAGDDGKVVSTNALGETRTLVTEPKRWWIDRVSGGADGAIAWAVGKNAFVQTPKREEKRIELPSSAGGLAFAPRGFRLAVSHYNGVSLWFPNAVGAAPERLEWKGSHLGVTFSPDGRFVVTTMQEPALHAWRLSDRKDMRMSGYPSPPRSLAWTGDGKFLATSGAEQVILWPFQGKDGPMGKGPRMLAPHSTRVAVVACHPDQDIIAAGYEDGLILLARLADGAEILIRKPSDAPVTALAWHDGGNLLAWGGEEGEAGTVDFT